MPPVHMCLTCKRLTDASSPRCPTCNATEGRDQRGARIVTREERARRAAAVAAHRASIGDWCVGYMRAAHAATDLTADHVYPVGAGGSEDGPLTVLCRECNGRRRATPPTSTSTTP